jgi:putative drug exporter of the RND superfamily
VISRLVTTHPGRVLGAAVALLLVAFAFGAPVAGLLETGDNFSDPGSESIAADDRLDAATASKPEPFTVVLVRPAARAASVERALARTPGIARTVSVADGPDPALVSRDGRSTIVLGYRADGTDEDNVGDAVKARFDGVPGVTVGGAGLAGPAVGDKVTADLARAELLAFPLLFLLSLLVFRGFVAALLPLFTGLFTVMLTFLALRVANDLHPLAIFALNLTTGLGLGLAIDYSLLMVSRFREELARGAEPRAAVARTMATAGRTIFFSSMTVAAAMLCLLVFPQRFLYSMGIAGALTAAIGATVALTALPALLTLLGRRVDALAPRRWQHREVATDAGFWYRLSRAVMRRPAPIAAAATILLLACAVPFLGIRFTGFDASVLPKDTAPRQVDDALRRDFPPGQGDPVTVALSAPRGDGAAVRAYANRLRTLRTSASVAPPRYLGRGTWQIDVFSGGRAFDDVSRDLVGDVRATPAPGPALVGGEAARFTDRQATTARRLPLAVAILVLTTLLILWVMTDSVVLPVKALAMNLLTVSAALGLLVLVFQDGRFESLLGYTGQGALESTQPLVLLAVAFGLSTDYGVFLLTRIKEARDAGAPNDEAVAIGLQRTGRIVTAAALLFSVAVGAFATSGIVFIKELGLGMVAAVLIDATIVRALLVPSLMKLLGEWNWWSPAPLRRLHAKLGRLRPA